jgi:8-oxo-dGTP pyrophosphatase MutT (NUDIX family)
LTAASTGIPVVSDLAACFVIARDLAPPRLLMLKRSESDPHAPGFWNIIYGHLEPGENPVACIVRELREETGLQASSLYTLNETAAFYDHSRTALRLTPFFVAFVSSTSPITVDPAEHLEAVWIDLETARSRLIWPAQKRALDVLVELLSEGALPPIMQISLTQDQRA